MGDAESGPIRLLFNPQFRVEFRGATVTADTGLLPRGSPRPTGRPEIAGASWRRVGRHRHGPRWSTVAGRGAEGLSALQGSPAARTLRRPECDAMTRRSRFRDGAGRPGVAGSAAAASFERLVTPRSRPNRRRSDSLTFAILIVHGGDFLRLEPTGAWVAELWVLYINSPRGRGAPGSGPLCRAAGKPPMGLIRRSAAGTASHV
jgi:hypothetical protein